MPQEKSVGAIIYREEDGQRLYLILRYKAKHWEFVKGHIDAGETDEQTLRREAKEEASLEDLKIIPGFKEITKFIFKQYPEKMSEADRKASETGKTIWVFKIVTFYLAKTNTENIKLSAEHQDYKWLDYEQAIKQTTFKGSKEILRKAHEFLEKQKTA